ncbi:EamA family transporter [Candidatus Micrarchaeota archaeon]|nr:EamA family transporter [Candidatus Micrarchaeota archaeon]
MGLNWLALAFIAMILFSVSNLLLKILASSKELTELPFTKLISVGALAVAFIVITYLSFFRHIDLGSNLVKMVAAIVLLSLIAFASYFYALREGKVALVTAVVSLSTIVVAFLSVIFLKESYSEKEVLAIALATTSILVMIL